MELEQAKELAKPFMDRAPNGKDTETICVMSDGGVYVNNDILKMKAHAATHKLQIFVLKGEKERVEQVAAEPVKEPAKEEPKFESKSKGKKKKKQH